MFYSMISLGCIYLGASYIIRRNPQYLWKPFEQRSAMMREALIQRGKKILHISHRGGSFENFENSEIAFQYAVKECKTDVIETDVCLTKDGQVVCLHDNNLERLCGIDKTTEEVNLSDIHFLNEIKLDFSTDRTFSTPVHSQIKPFLLNLYLYDKLYIFQSNEYVLYLKGFILEISKYTHKPRNKNEEPQDNRKGRKSHLTTPQRKYHSTSFATFQSTQYNPLNKQQWGSFDQEFSRQMEEQNQEITRFLSTSEFMLFMFSHAIGILPFLKIRGQIFQIPFFTDDYFQSSLLQQTSRMGQWRVRIQFALMKQFIHFLASMNEHLNKRGVLVFYWVLNQGKDFQSCLSSNPNGIITDTPSLLNAFLIANNKRFSH